MTAAPPGFILNPVKNRTVAALQGAKTLGLILHVQAGNGALGGWFNNPAASASSTWWAGKTGGREQYGDPDRDKFWAQAAGNSTYHSIETEGIPSEPLTAAQIESVAQAFAWGHKRYGWKLVLAEKPGDPGLGWHGMGGKAWGGHTGCPGDKRKAQRAQILARAKEIVGPSAAPTKEADMPLTEDDARTILTGSAVLKNPFAANPDTAPRVAASYVLEQTAAKVAQLAKAAAPSAPTLSAADINAIATKTADLISARMKA